MFVMASGSQEAARLATNSLAQELRTPADDIVIVSVDETQWPDTSLGCPEEGKAYAQVIVPGYRVRARAGDIVHDVHVGAGRAVVCDRGRPGSSASSAAAAKLPALARKDLAGRLKVPEKEIVVALVRPTTWPDAALGCGSPRETIGVPSAPGAAAPVKGYVIELTHGGKTYRYHADESRVVACDRE
jgi:hypothetical protein